jgi:hypothetical protein
LAKKIRVFFLKLLLGFALKICRNIGLREKYQLFVENERFSAKNWHFSQKPIL